MHTKPQKGRRTEALPRSSAEYFTLKNINFAVADALKVAAAEKPHGRPAKVLDVGCGGQPYRKLAERSGYQYYGVDISAQEGVDIFCTAALDVEIPIALQDAGPFDLVICTEVFEHVFDLHCAMANLKRLTASNGYLVVTTPFIYRLHEVPFDYWRPTPFALSRLASNHGFDIVKSLSLGSAADSVGLVCGLYEPSQTTSKLKGRMEKIACRIVAKLLQNLKVAETSGKSGMFVTNYMLLRRDDS